MTSLWDKTTLGRTGLRVSRLGIGSSGGLRAADVERAVERGVNYLYWGSIRRGAFGEAVREVARRRREELVVVVQSYTRVGWLMKTSLDSALRKLGLEYTDLLLLGWWNAPPPRRILDAALALRDAGKVKHVMISCHHRPTFERYIADPTYGAIMVRYNAAHPGAEGEVFPHLEHHARNARPGVVAYTATRWGALLDPSLTPPGEKTPRGADCYRFALSNPAVDVTLCGPADAAQLDEAMTALDRGPLDPDELAWMKRVGVGVRAVSASRGGNLPIQLLDRLAGGGAR
jgi:aryl-alcohol dehydrogenase-like predicted oxidoreductase